MKKIIALTLCVLFLLVVVKFIFADDKLSDLIKSSRNSLVAIVYVDGDKFFILGTGFFVDGNGTIATCRHIVKDLKDVYVMQVTEVAKASLVSYISTEEGLPRLNLPVYQVKDTNIFIRANITNILPDIDLAILKINQKNSNYLEIGEYNLIEEGDDLIFLGFPFGLNRVIAHKGMVSYKGKFNISGDLKDQFIEAVQIDGIVNRGNSGGPLISVSQKRVVGIIKASYGNIGPYLRDIQEGKIATKGIGLGQVDFGIFTREVVDAIDRHIQMGIGYAISVNYLKQILPK